MVLSNPDSQPLTIRPCQYRDLDKMADVSGHMKSGLDTTHYGTRLEFSEQLHYVRQWYGPLKCLQLFPNPLQHFFSTYVAECQNKLSGFIQVSPFNVTHSTWRVERIAAFPPAQSPSKCPAKFDPSSADRPLETGPSTPVSPSSQSSLSSSSSSSPKHPVVSVNRVTSPEVASPEAVEMQDVSAQTLPHYAENSPDPDVSHKLHPSPERLAELGPLATDVASQLLRHCLDTLWEARTWMVEVGVSDKQDLALYRHHGFQPLAHVTYWAIAPNVIDSLASRSATTLNLRPVSNADAGLLHQLDTVSMPPLVRQVFDRHVSDFKTSLTELPLIGIQRLINPQEIVRNYVFEPQRKAAIGYFQLQLCPDGSQPHTAELTVHPAYTWLYPELLTQMAQIVQKYPAQSIQLTSSDYQTEREEYLEQVGANRIQHTLLMSRSVWHKVRENKHVSLENLQLSGMLQGWQQGQKPIPGRFSFNSDRLPRRRHASPAPRDDQGKNGKTP